MNKTNFAIKLLLEAYADENNKVDMVHLVEGLAGRLGEVCEQFGKLDPNDDEKLILFKAPDGIEIFETVGDIAYAAGKAHYYSGNSRADVQEFIRLAHKFEEEYKEVDWDNQEIDDDFIDYMDAIDQFIEEELKPVKKLDFDYPNGTKYPWDNIEIAGCKQFDNEVCRVDDETEDEPDFWTVYLHEADGGVMAVADLPTLQHAQKLADLINNAVISFKDNGYLPLHRDEKLHRQFNLMLDERINMAHSNETKAAYEIVKRQFNDLVKA